MKVSIVIPSLNQKDFIEDCLESVLRQTYKSFEVIVQDGKSTDGSIFFLKKYESSFLIYSEVDVGQANAINKGFEKATGDIYAWLNTDDIYYQDTLAQVVSFFQTNNDIDVVYGACRHFFNHSKKEFTIYPHNFSRKKLTYSDFIVQPSCFWRAKVWDKTGLLNEKYNYAFDWEWFLRASQNFKFAPTQLNLSMYRIHPSQKTQTGSFDRCSEIIKIVEKYASIEWFKKYEITYNLITQHTTEEDFFEFRNQGKQHWLYYKLLQKVSSNDLEIILPMLLATSI